MASEGKTRARTSRSRWMTGRRGSGCKKDDPEVADALALGQELLRAGLVDLMMKQAPQRQRDRGDLPQARRCAACARGRAERGRARKSRSTSPVQRRHVEAFTQGHHHRRHRRPARRGPVRAFAEKAAPWLGPRAPPPLRPTTRRRTAAVAFQRKVLSIPETRRRVSWRRARRREVLHDGDARPAPCRAVRAARPHPLHPADRTRVPRTSRACAWTCTAASTGARLRFNGQEGLFRFPNGATMEINQLADATDYAKYQGARFTPPADRRGGPVRDARPAGQAALEPARAARTAAALRARGESRRRRAPMDRSRDTCSGLRRGCRSTSRSRQRQFVYAPSMFLDNPFIDQRRLSPPAGSLLPHRPRAAARVARGRLGGRARCVFRRGLVEDRNAIDPWPGDPRHAARRAAGTAYIAHDFGISAPSVTYFCVESPRCRRA